jgi:hypothetical protein
MTQPSDIAVISCHFNPCSYRSRQKNLERCIAQLAQQSIAPFLAHLAFRDDERLVQTADTTIIALRGRDVMWHKERLLNLLVRRLPPRFTKVAWLDADVLFPHAGWLRQASELLEKYSLIQLFDRAEQHDGTGRTAGQRLGLAAYIAAERPDPFRFDLSQTWPGLAWAARRKTLEAHGLLDTFIVGGADTYMSLAAFGRLGASWHVDQLAPKLQEAWSAWAVHFHREVHGTVGFLPMRIVQLAHGSKENRNYVGRMTILKKYDYDPRHDLAPDASGVWQWASAKPLFHRAVRGYFEARKEDAS